MAEQRACFFVTMVVVIVASSVQASGGLPRTVGDSRWSIPPFPIFYRLWSSLHFFQTGDSIVFDFDTGFYNVVQVSGEEYDRCTSDNPLRIMSHGPATVLLSQVGVFYYICNISDYCRLGQKVSIIVHTNRFRLSPPPPPRSLPPPPAMLPPSSGGANCSQSPMTEQVSPAPEPAGMGTSSEAPTSAQPSSVSSLGFEWATMICILGLFCLFL